MLLAPVRRSEVMVATRLVVVSCLAAASVSLLAAEEPLPLRDVLARAATAAERFGQDLQGIVAREQYLQTIRPWMGSPPERPAEVPPMQSRRLLASLLLVHDPATPWQLHRDVLSVDDEPVQGREARLAALFADPAVEARDRLRRITEDSARHNLGHVRRTINVPTFPLLLVIYLAALGALAWRIVGLGRDEQPVGTPPACARHRHPAITSPRCGS